MGSYTSADVLCPFYRRDDPKNRTITCEGVLPGTTVKHHCGGGNRHILRIYCCSNYKLCPWFHIVSYKWEKWERPER